MAATKTPAAKKATTEKPARKKAAPKVAPAQVSYTGKYYYFFGG